MSAGSAQVAVDPAAPACKRPELAWDFWLDFTRAYNPGIEHVEMHDPERARLLAEYSCAEGAEDCPPDHVYSFYCQGNALVMVVFVKDRCVTLVEELTVERYRRVIEGEYEC